MGDNSELTPGPQMMTSSLLPSAKIQLQIFHLFLCHYKELNGWIKNHMKIIPKNLFLERYNQVKMNIIQRNNWLVILKTKKEFR